MAHAGQDLQDIEGNEVLVFDNKDPRARWRTGSQRTCALCGRDDIARILLVPY